MGSGWILSKMRLPHLSKLPYFLPRLLPRLLQAGLAWILGSQVTTAFLTPYLNLLSRIKVRLRHLGFCICNPISVVRRREEYPQAINNTIPIDSAGMDHWYHCHHNSQSAVSTNITNGPKSATALCNMLIVATSTHLIKSSASLTNFFGILLIFEQCS